MRILRSFSWCSWLHAEHLTVWSERCPSGRCEEDWRTYVEIGGEGEMWGVIMVPWCYSNRGQNCWRNSQHLSNGSWSRRDASSFSFTVVSELVHIFWWNRPNNGPPNVIFSLYILGNKYHKMSFMVFALYIWPLGMFYMILICQLPDQTPRYSFRISFFRSYIIPVPPWHWF